MPRTVAFILLATALAAALGWLLLTWLTEPLPIERLRGMPPVTRPLSLAVLGDSDSHAYQDRVSFPPGSSERGGAMRQYTLQWTEILDRVRGSSIDQGVWGEWGTRGVIARAQRAVGLLSGRIPRKEDFRYNFAISGAVCGGLMSGVRAQAPFLVRLMDLEPERWKQGVVLIRLGGNPLARAATLDKFARDPMDPASQATLDMCVEDIRQATQLVLARHPQTRIVLVGIFDNSHWARYHDRWHSPEQLRHIATALDRYDDALQAMARSDPRIAFFDDRAWFDQRWGRRDPVTGRPAYREVQIGKGLRVTNTLGDELNHSCIADGHAGTVWNALWAQSLVGLLNDRFALGIAPIGDAELHAVIDPDGRFGTR